jgi:hypothetical protein
MTAAHAGPDDRRPGSTAPDADELAERARVGPAAGVVPNEEEVAREFPHGDGRPLAEQRDLVDADGDDIRQYTGEPVETEEGTVLPQQMVTGAPVVVGHGEFPNTAEGDADAADDEAVRP